MCRGGKFAGGRGRVCVRGPGSPPQTRVVGGQFIECYTPETGQHCPQLSCVIDIIVSVKRNFTKKLTMFTQASYHDRLEVLHLGSSELRSIKADFTCVC